MLKNSGGIPTLPIHPWCLRHQHSSQSSGIHVDERRKPRCDSPPVTRPTLFTKEVPTAWNASPPAFAISHVPLSSLVYTPTLTRRNNPPPPQCWFSIPITAKNRPATWHRRISRCCNLLPVALPLAAGNQNSERVSPEWGHHGPQSQLDAAGLQDDPGWTMTRKVLICKSAWEWYINYHELSVSIAISREVFK